VELFGTIISLAARCNSLGAALHAPKGTPGRSQGIWQPVRAETVTVQPASLLMRRQPCHKDSREPASTLFVTISSLVEYCFCLSQNVTEAEPKATRLADCIIIFYTFSYIPFTPDY
jgi:hypothetical protein